MRGSIFGRMAKGAFSAAFGQAVNSLVQLVSVPVLLSFWGQQMYGEWLLLTAIPHYLITCDMGFTEAANREMTMYVGRQDHAGALRIFQSCLCLTLGMSAITVLAAAVLAQVVPVAGIFNFSLLTAADVRLLLPLLALQVALNIQIFLMNGTLVSEGRYGEGHFLLSSARLVEFSCLWLAVALGGGPLAAIVASLAGKAGAMVAFHRMALRYSSWLRYGFGHASLETVRGLFLPAMATISMPLSHALNIQGLRMVVGYVLGPGAVVVFSTIRTMTRFIHHALTSVDRLVTPELGAAYGSGDVATMRMLHRRSCQTSLWLALAALLFFVLAGNWIFAVWTRGQLALDMPTFYILLVVTAVQSLWQTSYMVEFATNRHMGNAGRYLLLNVLCVAVCLVLCMLVGVAGASLALVILELSMLLRVLPASLRHTEDTLRDFLGTVLLPPVFLVPAFFQALARVRSRLARNAQPG